ncbi:MAG TPA: MlaE family lipid ABC transporter permease subunit [Polyangiaceae bacterium]|nr:MlaE family lipid ABC transporter permease subunit [Polyangiaceae bacterium]
MSDPGFSLDVRSTEDATGVFCFRGRLELAHAASLWDETTKLLLARAPALSSRIDFDLSGVTAVDGGAMALLVHLRNRLEEQGVRSEFVGARRHVQEIVHLYEGDMHLPPRRRRKAEGTLAQIGRATVAVLLEAKLVFAFFGQMLLSVGATIRAPRTGNWKDVTPTMERAGADAVPIVVLINFLIGFVMAFQGAVQLKQFGADIFVADLVGLSITRELGPLMTAIIVCGRSGAAFAAELGSMKVSEEIDALRTMGFGPMRFLVLPRALALVLVLPALTLIADFVGILGGLVVGLVSLHLSVAGYVTETVKAVHLWDVYSGVLKSVVFALAIVLVACQQGLATTGGAEGVGRRTTAAVVTTLFSLILLDAGFTILFHAFHL